MSRTRYLAELESVRQNLVEMGETVLTLFDEAVGIVSEPNPDRSTRDGELEAQTDHQHRLIHDKCLNLIEPDHAASAGGKGRQVCNRNP